MKITIAILCTLGAVAGFMVLPDLVWNKAPLQYDLYINQKIFYYHVPAAFVAFLSVFVSGIASIGFLTTRRPGWDDVAGAAGDLVVVFGAIVLTTGPIWGKAAWGVFWVWDPRLTSTLLLWMIFLAYALIRRFGGPGSERLAAGLALFGMVDCPLVYFAVNFWKTQHPTNGVVPKLHGGMLIAFLVGVLAYHLLFVVLLLARVGLRKQERRLNELLDLAAESGILES